MTQQREHTNAGLWAILTVIFLLLILEYLLTNNFFTHFPYLLELYSKISPKMFLFRSIYIVLLIGTFYLIPSIKLGKETTKKQRIFFFILMVITSGLIILGYTNIPLYNIAMIPLLHLSNIYFTAKAISHNPGNFKDDIIFGTSDKKITDIGFTFQTKSGTLNVHNPYQGIWIEGGAGSGKSVSLIEPIIYQAIKQGYSGIVYDFKGNPPTLGLTAYNTIKSLPKIKTQFEIINFSQLTTTTRCNPIAPRYLKSKLYAMEVADIIMKNLNPEWIQKKDFWAENAINFLQGIIWFLRKNNPEYCTLPHVISLTLNDYDKVLRLLSKDEEVRTMMLPVMVAHEKNAEGQIAGVISSVQLPLNKLYTEEIFWVLSKDELDLDLSNPEHPTILSISNDPAIQESLRPAISLILSAVMQQINQQGKNKSLFCVDELPTIYIKKLDQLPATARSNKVATVLAVQDYSQLKRDYGEKEAMTILSNLGNQFTGMTNNQETSKRIAQILGKIKKTNTSVSESMSQTTQSVTTQMHEVLQEREIAGQPIGHFTGKIAGGNPPFFHTQFNQFLREKKIPNYKNNIPSFALEKEFEGKIAIKNKELETKIFSNLVKENFQKINTEIKKLLDDRG